LLFYFFHINLAYQSGSVVEWWLSCGVLPHDQNNWKLMWFF
jgi:hypothetical protein